MKFTPRALALWLAVTVSVPAFAAGRGFAGSPGAAGDSTVAEAGHPAKPGPPANAAPAEAPRGATTAAHVPARALRELVFLLRTPLGLPADSAARKVFLEAFRAELEERTLPTEKLAGTAWTAADTQASAFRMVEAAPADQAWTLELSLRFPPEVRVERRAPRPGGMPPPARLSRARASRGLVVAATAHAPARSGRPVEASPQVFMLYFPDARRIVVPSAGLPGGGYAYPWRDAGRVVARAALEALHRASGVVAVDERVNLAPAARVESTP